MINKSDNAISLSLPPTPPGKFSSQDKNECQRAVTIDDTMIKNIPYYHKLGARIPLSREWLQNRRDNYQPKPINFENMSEKPTMGQIRQLPFRLHCTIRFSIDDKFNILSPNSKTIHTKYTKPASF